MTFSGAVTSRPSIENVAILIAGRGISGSSRDVPSERPAAGAARQGRRSGAMLVALPGPRTPHGGDRRPATSGGTLRGRPLRTEQPQPRVTLPRRVDTDPPPSPDGPPGGGGAGGARPR